MKKRILFVDDDANVLEMLRHMFARMWQDWDCRFAESGEQALQWMQEAPFDVVVSDLRMPGMGGADLLEKINAQYPSSIRMVFSSESEDTVAQRLVGSTHQFLLKPYDLTVIRETIDRALRLRDMLSSDSVRAIVAQIKSLPSVPALYFEVVTELESPNPSMEKVGEIIRKDMAMSAKLLQLVNSAYFGLRQHVSNTSQAASLLGAHILKSLVLVVHIFSQQPGLAVRGLTLDQLWNHSLAVALKSQDIALHEEIERSAADYAFVAGLFHDLGKLVLMANAPVDFGRAMDLARKERSELVVAEKFVLGASHAEIGAYLLGLWGFADPLLDAVAFHHQPRQSHLRSFGPLTTVHVANVLENEAHPPALAGAKPALDREYLEEAGKLNKLAAWRKVCAG